MRRLLRDFIRRYEVTLVISQQDVPRILSDYSKHELKHPSDSLNALLGISESSEQFTTSISHHYLVVPILPLFTCDHTGPTRHRAIKQSLAQRSQVVFTVTSPNPRNIVPNLPVGCGLDGTTWLMAVRRLKVAIILKANCILHIRNTKFRAETKNAPVLLG